MSDINVVVSGNNSKIELEQAPEGLLLRVVGLVDEHIKFQSVLSAVAQRLKPGEILLIDLLSLLRMNSVGLREWLFFLQNLQNAYNCKFKVINEHTVLQASMIPIILGKAGTPVLSFECPYRCEKGKGRTTRVVGTSSIDIRNGRFEAPAALCETCNIPLEFDSLTEEYFSFLRHSGKS